MYTPEQMADLAQRLTKQEHHQDYELTKQLAEAIAIHAKGLKPEALLKTRRPGEEQALQEYRMNVYQPITKTPYSKIQGQLQSIRRAKNFALKWPDVNEPKITSGQSLSLYCNDQFGPYKDVINWAFRVALPELIIDANALVLVWDFQQRNRPSNEYPEPLPWLFESKDVIWYAEDVYAVLRSKEYSMVQVGNESKLVGEVYYVLTKTTFQVITQVGQQSKREFRENPERMVVHNLGYLPCYRPGGRVRKVNTEGFVVYESVLDGCLPYWNLAVGQFSDHQAVLITHTYPEKVTMSGENCNECQGNGQVKSSTGAAVNCQSCGGSGYQRPSPFKGVHIDPMAFKDSGLAIPNPAVYYVEKDVETTRILKEEVEDNIRKAYAAVNMDFLDNVPLNQSGRAKEYDRQELNKFLHEVGLWVMQSIVMQCIRRVNDLRYGAAVPTPENRAAQLPKYNVPDTYDMLTINDLLKLGNDIDGANISQVAKGGVNLQIAAQQFGVHSLEYRKVELQQLLDPVPGMSLIDKDTLLQRNAITQRDYVLSVNLVRILNQIEQSEPDLLEADLNQLQAKIDEILNEMLPNGGAEGLQLQSAAMAAITAMQRDVNAGLITREQAIGALVVLGYAEDLAEKIIATPVAPPAAE